MLETLALMIALQVPVMGTVPVTAQATDNVGVVKTEFFLDGQFIQEILHSAPGLPVTTDSIQWDTLPYSIGQHTLIARAWDTAGNFGDSPPVVVDVQNPDTEPPTVVITQP